MKFVPFHYQPRMINHMRERDVSALFCSPSMGKTACVLDAAGGWLLNGEARGVLIVAPIRVCSITWPNQIRQWDHSSWMRVAHLRTSEGLKAWKDGSAEVYLINPEQLPKLVPLMFTKKNIAADVIIIDELSLAKNPTSKRFNALRPYLQLFNKRVGLTGTPIPNNYLDLFAQIRLLDDGARLGKSFHQYQRTYFESDFMGYRWSLRPGAKEIIDQKIADLALVMLGDDYLDIPTCSTVEVEVTLPPEAKAAYKTLEKELLLELEKSDVLRDKRNKLRSRQEQLINMMGLDSLDIQSPFIPDEDLKRIQKRYLPLADEYNRIIEEIRGSDVIALTAATLANKLLQMTSGSVYAEDKSVVHEIHSTKIDALKKLRKKHGKEPMLVLVGYKHESARILKAIPGARMFDEKDLGAWQRGEIHTWVADFRSLSHGIDGIQNGGRIAVWVTLPWSNEGYMQTNARVVRTGQSSETIIYRIIVSGTMDDAVAEALREKSDNQSGMFNALKALQKLVK